MITVKDIISRKQKTFNTINPNDLVIDALVQLNAVNISYLVVMENEKFKGIFCERDYTRNVVLKGRSSKTTKVEEVMTTDLPVVRLTDTAEHCMNMLSINKTRYIVAYDNDHNFQAVITIHDMLREVIANKEVVFDKQLTKTLLDYDEKVKVF